LFLPAVERFEPLKPRPLTEAPALPEPRRSGGDWVARLSAPSVDDGQLAYVRDVSARQKRSPRQGAGARAPDKDLEGWR